MVVHRKNNGKKIIHFPDVEFGCGIGVIPCD